MLSCYFARNSFIDLMGLSIIFNTSLLCHFSCMIQLVCRARTFRNVFNRGKLSFFITQIRFSGEFSTGDIIFNCGRHCCLQLASLARWKPRTVARGIAFTRNQSPLDIKTLTSLLKPSSVNDNEVRCHTQVKVTWREASARDHVTHARAMPL